jgi:hypothetical protein
LHGGAISCSAAICLLGTISPPEFLSLHPTSSQACYLLAIRRARTGPSTATPPSPGKYLPQRVMSAYTISLALLPCTHGQDREERLVHAERNPKDWKVGNGLARCCAVPSTFEQHCKHVCLIHCFEHDPDLMLSRLRKLCRVFDTLAFLRMSEQEQEPIRPSSLSLIISLVSRLCISGSWAATLHECFRIHTILKSVSSTHLSQLPASHACDFTSSVPIFHRHYSSPILLLPGC